MKKTYLSPNTTILVIEVQQVIAASPAGTDVKDGGASSDYETLSRRSISVWDDEEGDYGDD